METIEALCLPFSHHCGRTLLITATSSDSEGVKIDWLILVPKEGTSAPYGGSDLVASVVIGLESRLVVRFDNCMVYALPLNVFSL